MECTIHKPWLKEHQLQGEYMLRILLLPAMTSNAGYITGNLTKIYSKMIQKTNYHLLLCFLHKDADDLGSVKENILLLF